MKKLVLLLSDYIFMSNTGCFIKSCFLLMIFYSTVYPQNFWERINSPTTQRLTSIVFLDSLNGWVSGDSGVIIHTTNGGESWETQFSNDSLTIVNLFFLNEQRGWAAHGARYMNHLEHLY